MAQSSGYFMPFRFDVSSPAFAVIFFGSTTFFNKVPDPIEAKNEQSATSIMLPNKVKYDPYQTYQSPQVPGITVITQKYIPKPGIDLSGAEVEISSAFDNTSANVGIRGILTVGSNYGSQYTSTARLIGVSFEAFHKFPRQIPTSVGGVGTATAASKGGVMKYTFDQITNWE
jgi:hypothetical protein